MAFLTDAVWLPANLNTGSASQVTYANCTEEVAHRGCVCAYN